MYALFAVNFGHLGGVKTAYLLIYCCWNGLPDVNSTGRLVKV